MSVDDGRVEVELYLAEDDELSCPPLEAEIFVPPDPLQAVNNN